MSIQEKRKKLILKGREIAKNSALLSFAVFFVSILVGIFVNSGLVASIFGDIRVFSFLFLALSLVSLLLIQMEIWEKDLV
jgi:hypothetical protein